MTMMKYRIDRRKALGLMGGAAAASLVPAPGARVSAQTLDKVSYLTNWRAQGEHGGFYLAVATGLYKKHGIECDLQVSADGEAMVYHDDRLGRLTEGGDRLDALPAAALKRVAFRASADRMLTLGELCDLVGGRMPLVLELKSRFDDDHRLAVRTARVVAGYAGPVAAMSFDPGTVAALPGILDGLDGRGLHPVTASTLLRGEG